MFDPYIHILLKVFISIPNYQLLNAPTRYKYLKASNGPTCYKYVTTSNSIRYQ